MLIALVYAYVKLRQIRGQQYRYTNYVINFRWDISPLVTKLPRLLSEYDMIVLKPANTNKNNRLQRQFINDQWVRCVVVHEWLLYLKEYHAGYRDIEIDIMALSGLSEDGDVGY